MTKKFRNPNPRMNDEWQKPNDEKLALKIFPRVAFNNDISASKGSA
jgi:hypothetical protein